MCLYATQLWINRCKTYCWCSLHKNIAHLVLAILFILLPCSPVRTCCGVSEKSACLVSCVPFISFVMSSLPASPPTSIQTSLQEWRGAVQLRNGTLTPHDYIIYYNGATEAWQSYHRTDVEEIWDSLPIESSTRSTDFRRRTRNQKSTTCSSLRFCVISSWVIWDLFIYSRV